MLKNSHFAAPRTLAECHFQTGYRPAMPRDPWADAGHMVLNFVSAAGVVVLVVMALAGVFE